MSSDKLSIGVDSPGAATTIRQLEEVKSKLENAEAAAHAFGAATKASGEEAAAALEKVQKASHDVLEIVDRIGTAAYLDDFSDRIKYAGESFMVAEDKSRSFGVRASAMFAGLSGITQMWVTSLYAGAQALAAGGAAAEQNERAVRSLGAAWQHVQQATNDTVSAQQAQTAQQALLRSGLSIQAEDLGVVARAARDYALATGTDTTAALTQLTSALQSGDTNALRPFGVTVREGTSRTRTFSTALEQLRGEQSRTAVEARSFAEDNERLSRSWTEMTNTVFSEIARWTDLRSNIVGVTDAIRELSGANDEANLRAASNDGARAAHLELVNQYNAALGSAARRGVRFGTALPNAMSLSDDDLARFTLQLNQGGGSEVLASVAEAGTLQDQRRAAAAAEAAGRAEERRLQGRADASVDRDRNTSVQDIAQARLQQAIRQMAKEVDIKRGALAASMGIDVSSLDTIFETRSSMRAEEEAKRRGQLTYEQEQNDATRARNLALASGVSQAGEVRATGFDAYTRARDVGAQVGDRFGGARSAAEQQVALTQQTADSVMGSYEQMTNGLNGFLDTLIESPEKAGEASIALAKNVLKGIALMAAQKSLFSLAEGFAALAGKDPASATAFFVASGIYAGVAVAAGAGAAGIAASQRGGAQATPPSNNSGSFGPARADSGRGNGQRGGDTYVISVNGSILDTGGFEEAVGRAVRGARGRGA